MYVVIANIYGNIFSLWIFHQPTIVIFLIYHIHFKPKPSTYYIQFHNTTCTRKETHSIQAIIPLSQQFPSWKILAVVSMANTDPNVYVINESLVENTPQCLRIS
jgi:hypothetical protein